MTAEEERLLEERLPWYVNANLPAAERAWVDALLQRSPQARERLAIEQALCAAVPGLMATAPQDVGLAGLLAQVRAERTQPAGAPSTLPAALPIVPPTTSPSAPSGWRAAVDRFVQWLVLPPVVATLALAVLLQFGVIGWLVEGRTPSGEAAPGADARGARSVPVADVRSLRVTFQAQASEAQVRSALVAAGARIIGGPTQFGEYWIVSDMLSLDEIRQSLQRSGVVATMEVDPAGPRGH